MHTVVLDRSLGNAVCSLNAQGKHRSRSVFGPFAPVADTPNAVVRLAARLIYILWKAGGERKKKSDIYMKRDDSRDSGDRRS